MLFSWSTCLALSLTPSHNHQRSSQSCFFTFNGSFCIVHFPGVLNETREMLDLDNTNAAKSIWLFSFLSLASKNSLVSTYISFFTKLLLTSNWMRHFLDLAFGLCFFWWNILGFSKAYDFLDYQFITLSRSG